MIGKNDTKAQIQKSDNQIKKEYFISQLRKMHKRLKGILNNEL